MTKIRLTENELKRVINNSVQRIISEGVGNNLDDAIDILFDAYQEINEVCKRDKNIAYELSTSLNGIKNAIRIIRNNAYNI